MRNPFKSLRWVLIVAWLLVLLHNACSILTRGYSCPLNPDIEFASLMHLFIRGQPPLIVSARLLVARATRDVTLFVNPPPCRYCSAHSTLYVCCRPSCFGTTTSFVRFHSHRTAVSRQELNSARHPVPSFAHYTTGAFPNH